ncbi:MAG: prepilin-type N-terminal cleavage/methylation domain-containing protein [Methylotenera sp.]|nr:prepilin-type N-terminal cleavage/methylation domain-containing protein [Oligoflexia bacterium]
MSAAPSKNTFGFTLIEVMIVCAIGAVLALGVSQLFMDMFRQQKTGQEKAVALQLQTTLQSAIADPAAIRNSSSQ